MPRCRPEGDTMATSTRVAVARTKARSRLPAPVRAEWDKLLAGAEPSGRFGPASVEHLPEPAKRWLRHAIAPGAPLQTCVELEQHGQIRLGWWRPFTAVQVLAPLRGYIWAESTQLLGLPIHG